MYKSIIFILLIGITIGCEKSNSDPSPPSNPIVFQMDYINQAWGFVHSGWFMDNEGYIYSYDLDETDNWAMILNGNIHEDSIQLNFNYSTLSDSVEIDSLQFHHNLSMQLFGDSLSPPETIIADAGIQNFYAYKYNSSCSCYESVVVKRYGDIIQTNTNPNAEQIYNWMKNIVVIFWFEL